MTELKQGLEARAGEVPHPTLTVAGAVKTYRRGWRRRRGRAVLRGADLELRPGEVVGLVGENGAGKSTLMKAIVRAVAHDAGEVHLRGRLGYCPQEPVLYARLTCDEHLELFGKAYGCPPSTSTAHVSTSMPPSASASGQMREWMSSPEGRGPG